MELSRNAAFTSGFRDGAGQDCLSIGAWIQTGFLLGVISVQPLSLAPRVLPEASAPAHLSSRIPCVTHPFPSMIISFIVT